MLNDQTVLIVEAEFLIALDIQTMLEALSASTLLFARSPLEAHQRKAQWSSIDLAIVEMSDECHSTISLLSGLRAAGAALVITTTDSTMRQGHPDFPGVPVIVKPMIEEEFRHTIGVAQANRQTANA